MTSACPFCGGVVATKSWIDPKAQECDHYAYCTECFAESSPIHLSADEALAAFTKPAHALRAALARAERAEALVREAGVMLKQREWDDPVCPEGYLEGMACSNCLAHEDNKHDPGCHYAALLARIAELEKP